ncbi:MAG: LysM peptidoglycan-binding domain-containing protein [Rudaea sp.]
MLRRAVVLPFVAALVITLGILGALVLPADAPSVFASGVLGESAAAPAPAVPANRCYHYVIPGDNLFRIGLRYGVSYPYLAQINGIPNPNLIYAGTQLVVPCGAGSSPAYPANCAPSTTYLVQPGDNLFRIAMNHETSLDLLRSQNGLFGRVLRSGTTLTVPCPGSVKYRYVPPPSGEETTPPVTPTPTPGPNTISIRDNEFLPNYLEVTVGTRVNWTNDEIDGTSHTVTSGVPGQPAGFFDSGPLAPGSTFGFTFTTPGIYSYYSSMQPDMTGQVKVNP